MSVTKKNFSVLSSDGEHTLSGIVFLKEGDIKPKGYFHVVHGMTEHIARYEKFMRDMAEHGFICFGYDNLGHGGSVKDDSELGFIAHKGGWEQLVADVKVFSDAVKAEYGEDLPYYLMGHSMGSFIVRLAAERHVRPDRLIIMGTGGSNPAANVGLALIGIIKKIKGERHFSPLVDKLAFGSYNKRFGGGSESDPSPWLTNDEGVRKAYYADKYCTFKFSVSAMGDLIRLTKYSNRSGWYKNLDKSIRILLVSGREDPVGSYGRGVEEVAGKLKKAGADAVCRIYEGARHEILNDFTYDEVKRDICGFCER